MIEAAVTACRHHVPGLHPQACQVHAMLPATRSPLHGKSPSLQLAHAKQEITMRSFGLGSRRPLGMKRTKAQIMLQAHLVQVLLTASREVAVSSHRHGKKNKELVVTNPGPRVIVLQQLGVSAARGHGILNVPVPVKIY